MLTLVAVRAASELERLDAEEVLSESERRFRELFENAPVGIFSTTSEGKPLVCNPGMAHILGFAGPQEALQQCTDLVTQFYVRPERRAEFVARLREQGMVEDFEFEAKITDGRHIWLSMNARVVEQRPDGSFTIEGFAKDITKRKQAEDALRERESFLRAVIDNIPFEFWARDLEGRCFMENAALVKHWGSQLGRRVEEVSITPEERALWQANNRRALAGEVVDEEVTYIVAGERRVFQNIIAPVRRSGEIRGILGLNIDITVRKRIEQTLAKERTFTDAVLDSVPGLLYLYDDQGLLLRWNRQHETLTGYSPEELAKMHLLDWYRDDPSTIDKITRGVQRVYADGFASEEAETSDQKWDQDSVLSHSGQSGNRWKKILYGRRH